MLFKIIVHICFAYVGASPIPKIEFLDPDSSWKSMILPNTNQKAYHKVCQQTMFAITCIAPYLTQWNITGSVAPQMLTAYRVQKLENEFMIAVSTVIPVQIKIPLRVTCEMIGKPSVKTEIFIFQSTNTSYLAQPSFHNVINSKVLPCPTLDPTAEVELYLRKYQGPNELLRNNDSSMQYHPGQGFVSENVFHGEFVCKQNISTVFITAESTISNKYSFEPATDEVKVFSRDTVKLKCSSLPEGSVTILFTNIENIGVKLRHKNNASRVIATVFPTLWPRDSATIEVGAVCTTNQANSSKIVIKKWALKFVPTPYFTVDNYNMRFECHSTSNHTKVFVFKCGTFPDCQFLKLHVNRNLISIDTEQQLGYCGDRRIKDCVSAPFAHRIAYVDCMVDGLNKRLEPVESLDQRMYHSWIDVPKRELIRLDEMPWKLSIYETVEFTCEALKHVFQNELQFKIGFRNKSSKLLRTGNYQANILYPNTHSRLIKNFNTIAILSITLPPDAVEINCVASFWNSAEIVVASRHFITTRASKPVIRSNADDDWKENIFFFGEVNKLVCKASGEPKPNFIWFYENKPVSNVFPKLKSIVGENHEGYLEFPGISVTNGEKYSGIYKCVARNRHGSAEKKFRLKFSEKESNHMTNILVLTSIIALTIVICLLSALIIFYRRYKNAKEMLRNLTDLEIIEFRKGRQDLIGTGSNIDTVDLLPYNMDYEIPLSDLEFSYSEHNLLGSGEYAFVVRGLILSKGKPVAIKVSKPSTNVTFFKSMLSEVKIMSYIGQHENVVTLIGVCTEAIKNRCIYIATDICELGNLHSFLIKSRPTFVNLLTVNQDIDLGLQPQVSTNPPQLTTIDLVSFAGQIAKGMEYLAYKMVIHADLATRNVLLTKERIVKISDFGLSKKLYERGNYVKKSKSPVPWRWMAIESLKTMTFSTSSDVWSFGVTLFEIFTLGDVPFASESWNDEFVQRLSIGLRMGRPEYASQNIYSKMVTCWEKAPELRPGFDTLRLFFENLYAKNNCNHSEVVSEHFQLEQDIANDSVYISLYDQFPSTST